MHPSPAFHWKDEAAMLAAAGAIGWARLFAMTSAGPRVAHSAVLVDPARRCLRFHLANNNLVTPGMAGGPVLAVFEGPHAYVSASWYPDPSINVPTWNYVAIECEGPVTALDGDALVDLLDDLAAANEGAAGERWSRSMMERKRFEAMLGAITAYELSIEAIRGTRKLSQNKKPADVETLARGVEQSGAVEVAALMRAGV